MNHGESRVIRVPSCPKCHRKDGVIKLTAAPFKYNKIIVEKITITTSYYDDELHRWVSNITTKEKKISKPWQGFQEPFSFVEVVGCSVIVLLIMLAIVAYLKTLWLKITLAALLLVFLGELIVEGIEDIFYSPPWKRSFFCERCGCAFDPVTKREKCKSDSIMNVQEYKTGVICPVCLSSDRVLSIAEILSKEIKILESNVEKIGSDRKKYKQVALYTERAFHFSSAKPKWSSKDRTFFAKTLFKVTTIGLIAIVALVITCSGAWIVWGMLIAIGISSILSLLIAGIIFIAGIWIVGALIEANEHLVNSLDEWKRKTLHKRRSYVHYCERCDILFIPGTKIKGDRNQLPHLLGIPIERNV